MNLSWDSSAELKNSDDVPPPILTCGRISFITLQPIDEQNSLAHHWHTNSQNKSGQLLNGCPQLFDNEVLELVSRGGLEPPTR